MISRRLVIFGVATGGVAFADPSVQAVLLEMEAGVIEVVVNLGKAPITAGDFLNYVDRRLFDGASFFRTVRPDNDPGPIKINVIQACLEDEARLLPPIAHEPTNVTGIHHRDGTLSIGRTQPGTGTVAAFFICIGEQRALDYGGRRNSDGQGFAAFGRVTGGMDVVHAIWRSKTKASQGSNYAQTLASPVRILRARRKGA
jgi:peptidyl-prolyl cis-trans isomerase A (cyclophilin A)